METGNPITITINGERFDTVAGKYLLDVCRENGIHIPTLCHHEAVTPAGACRLCVVEVKDGKGWSRVVVSCVYPCWDGMIVETDSARVIAVRKLVLETLLARCPTVPLIRNLAKEYGITQPRFPLEDHECILCSLCVRVCSEVVGVHALSMQGRGAEKTCGTPYLGSESTCIGCGACVYICPTECIHMEDKDGVRTIWHEEAKVRSSVRQFKLVYCKVCGALIGPDAYVEYLRKKGNVPEDLAEVCLGCRATRRSLGAR